MEIKEKALKSSGSCPIIAKRKLSRTCISFRSSTVLAQSERRMNKRLSRGAKIRVDENIGSTLKNQSLRNQQISKIHRVGDAFDYNLQQCSPPRPVLKSGTVLWQPSKASTSSSYSQNSLVQSRHIDVIVRIRPMNKSEECGKKIVWRTTDTTLLFDPKEKTTDFYFKGKRQSLRNDFGSKRPNKNLSFAFDYVYGPDSTNQQIFDISLKGLIEQVVEGFNCTIFAYGATGSGKTYTMLGSGEQSGITVLMAEELYRRLEDLNEDYTNEVTVSYLEVYNEAIKDLLNPDKELHIREDGKQGIRIPHLTIHRPQGAEQLLQLLKNGNNARSQHATDFNAESSRSHAVFEITVLIHQHSPLQRFKVKTASSKLFMVDLAGSERGIFNGLDGMRQREGSNINKSLLALSNCINALADGKTHIPYRNSKLTRLLKDSLSGNCVTVMIANISPSEFTFDDTHNTLHYANRAKHIKVTCKKNCFSEELIEESATNDKIMNLENKIRLLKNQLDEERNEHQRTRDILQERQIQPEGGEGDVTHPEIHSPMTMEMASVIDERPTSVIHDPAALDHFLELLKQKTNYMASLTESSVKARHHEWEMNWKRLKVDMADYVGKLEVSDPHFITLAKLRNTQSDLFMAYPELASAADETKKKLVLINSEIENVYQKYLKTLKLNDPFLKVNFKEFISYKQMQTETITLEELSKFYQKLSETIFNELVNAQIHLLHSTKLIQSLSKVLQDHGLFTSELDNHFHAILAPTYGCNHLLEPANQQRKCPIQEDISNLKKTVHRPVVNFPSNEPSLGSSSILHISHKESSDIPPTTAGSTGTKNVPVDTSDKDTHLSSADETPGNFQNHNISKKPFLMKDIRKCSPSVESDEKERESAGDVENMAVTASSASGSCSSSSINSIGSQHSEECFSVEYKEPNTILGKKTCQTQTSKNNPGNNDNFLRRVYKNESTIIGIRPTKIGMGVHIRPRNTETSELGSKRIGLHCGKVMTNLTEVVSRKSSHHLEANYSNLKKFSKPNPIITTRIIHPVQDKSRRPRGGRPFTFMYTNEDNSSASTLKK